VALESRADWKSEKPRKSRERKRSKRLKRQQPERKEKYRERQCRANRKQHHKLSKPSARHDIQRQLREALTSHLSVTQKMDDDNPQKAGENVALNAELQGVYSKFRCAPDAQAVFCRRRHQARRPPQAKMRPGNARCYERREVATKKTQYAKKNIQAASRINMTPNIIGGIIR
jgi:NAD-dependent SIR2 family protein deacetylase